MLLKPVHRRLVSGFLINKFRGDITILAPAIKEVQKMTKKRIIGVVPKIDHDLPVEDSLDGANSNGYSVTGSPEFLQESWNRHIDHIAEAIKENVDIESVLGVAGLA